MFWNNVQFRTVTSRLTFWYVSTCTLLVATAFLLAYMRIDANSSRDIDHELINELQELNAVWLSGGVAELQKSADGEADSEGVDHVFIRLISPLGEPRVVSDLHEWNWLNFAEIPAPATESAGVVLTTIYPTDYHKNTRIAVIKNSDGSVLQLGFNLHHHQIFLKKIGRTFIICTVACFLFSLLAGQIIARKTMAGVQRVTRAASRIRKDNLNSRVPLGTEGLEVETLASAFNEMLERIEALVRELKEISDNVAHDLRSPITRMRGAAETTLTGPQDMEAYREMGVTIIEESERLTQIINTALEIAQAEAGLLQINRKSVDLTALLKNVVELFQPVADEKQIELCLHVAEDPIRIHGDITRLQRTVANLLDNAIKYTPVQGRVTISAGSDQNWITLEFSDTGMGISPEEIDRIFERFYRSEKSRSTQGNGLGLSLARTIVQLHGGRLTVQSTLNQGSTFTITLPVDRES